MDATKLNLLITSLANHFFDNLSPEEFWCLNIIISELSKTMFSMSLLRDVCFKMDKSSDKEKEKTKAPASQKGKNKGTEKEKDK